jgi:fluoride exporter
LGPGFPFATLVVNVVGSFAMGLLFVVLVERGGGRFAPLVLTGILGGFTTFSAFSLDTLALVEKGQGALALFYVAASVGLSLGAVVAGLALGRGMLA